MIKLNKDKDGYAQLNDNLWIQPEDVLAIENGTLSEAIEAQMVKLAKENNISAIGGNVSYYLEIIEALNLDIDVLAIRNAAVKEHSTIKSFKSCFSLGN